MPPMATVSHALRFAQRTARMRASTIREMLKVTQQPNVISFGGGLPAPELFPTDAIADATRAVMNEYGPLALQYSVTEGTPEMRRWVAQRLGHRFDMDLSPSNVMILNGSQQGLDLIAKIFIDPGDQIVLESPSYLGAIQAFDAYQARYLTVETDDEGMIPESLEHVLEHADPFPKFVYLGPTFQNPTGRTLSRERRERIVAICEKFELPILEDDPYGELRFEGDDLPSLLSLARKATVIYLGTGSKIVAPGMRVAWVVTKSADVLEKIALAKQAADLQANSLTQYVFHRYATSDQFDEHVRTIVRTYRERRDVMLDALAEHMPASTRFNRPSGGMFLWVSLPGIDTEELLPVCAEQRVFFVPGVFFYPNDDVHDGMRLNFSNAGNEKIRLGIARLAEAVRGFRK